MDQPTPPPTSLGYTSEGAPSVSSEVYRRDARADTCSRADIRPLAPLEPQPPRTPHAPGAMTRAFNRTNGPRARGLEPLTMFTPSPPKGPRAHESAVLELSVSLGSILASSTSLDSHASRASASITKGPGDGSANLSLSNVTVEEVAVSESEFTDKRGCRTQTAALGRLDDWLSPGLLVPCVDDTSSVWPLSQELDNPLSPVDALGHHFPPGHCADRPVAGRRVVATCTQHRNKVPAADPHAIVSAMMRGKAWAGLPVDYSLDDSMSRSSISWRGVLQRKTPHGNITMAPH